jgi:geranylgeranyl pyrophosphate synthase
LSNFSTDVGIPLIEGRSGKMVDSKMSPSESSSPSALDTVLDTEIRRIAEPLLAGAPTHLRESILYSLLGPGKRIRPRILLAVAEALRVDMKIAHRLAAALEMVHAYTLVHDDLPAMDNDDFRRGRPTNHKVYGEATAVLAGDSLALLGIDAIARTPGIPAERLLAAATLLLEVAGARGVIAGQAAESALKKDDRALSPLLEVFRLKTGALFQAALVLPVRIAELPAEHARLESALTKLGDAIGIAFQIADDLEDDFSIASANPAHIASRISKQEAKALAIATIEAAWTDLADTKAGGREELLAKALAPFRKEIEKKLQAASES